eukprot:TRINITY_DN26746_c0_g1_i2.p2 TRINITY_DN26746_c0_g1~~TRINITY_DN26746_c0_g1_i2.p2  ORF type:complete len:110 (-),score=52.26 TRINITY_DN26746_c0_g1_i2:82-411(-)
MRFIIFFFFFKQKTAYEMLRSLVGSEMCIRDRRKSIQRLRKECNTLRTENEHNSKTLTSQAAELEVFRTNEQRALSIEYVKNCLLYTSDAADEEDSVDLGGRRIIKKKK